MPKLDSRKPSPEESQPGSYPHPERRGVENAILQALPDSEYAGVQPHLEFVEFSSHQVLQEPDEKIEFGYFINNGLVSLLVVTTDARSVEVGIVGKEGFVGAPLALGLRDSSQRALIQIDGS